MNVEEDKTTLSAATHDVKDPEKATEDRISVENEPLTVLKHADKNDADVALQAIALGEAISMTPEEEKKLLRKIDLHIMPLLCVVYGLNYLDKTTLSYASVMGLKTDLQISGSQYSWMASMFYFGYVVFEWPTSRLLQRLPLAKWSAFNIIMWGLVLACLGAVKNFAGAMTARFFLGLFESAVTPGFALFTSQWYTVREQGFRTGIWFSFNGWGQILGGSVAYGIAVGTAEHPMAIKGWQLLFMILGLFTAAIGVLFLLFMPDNQLNARFLTQKERLMAVERIRINQQGLGNKHFKMYQFRDTMTDPMMWTFVLFSLVCSVPNGGITNFFSLLIVSFGYSHEQSLLLSTPAGAFAGIVLVLAGYLGDKFRNRLLVSSGGLVIAILGILLITCLPDTQKTGKLCGYYMTMAVSPSFVNLLSLISTNIAGWTRKTTTAAMYLIAYCVGNIIGPQLFNDATAPDYLPGKITIIVCYCLCLADLGFMYFWCVRQNKKKAEVRAQPGYQKIEGQEFYDLTDRENPEFVYSV